MGPWKAGNPSHYNNEFCVAIDEAKVGWNDVACDQQKHILCNRPSNSSSIVIDEILPIKGHLFGMMDILDDVHVEFDFIISSTPTEPYTNILHIGSLLFGKPQLPSIFIQNYLDYLTVNVRFSVIEDTNARINSIISIALAKWYHLSFDITQRSADVLISLNGITIDSLHREFSSHAILRNQDIYLSNPIYTSVNGSLRNVKITTNNAYSTPFDYLCDYDNRFTVLSGSWRIDSQCVLVQYGNKGGVVWLGDKDTTSIEWTDYSIEFVVNLYHLTNSTNAHAGVLFRALSVNYNLDGGQQFLVALDPEIGIRLSTVDNGISTDYLDVTNISLNQYYTVRVEVQGNVVSVYLDNQHRFDAPITAYNHGSIGLRTYRCHAWFQRLRIIFSNTNSRISTVPTAGTTLQPSSFLSLQPTASDPPTLYPTLPATLPATDDPSHPTLSPTNIRTKIPASTTPMVPNISKEPIMESTMNHEVPVDNTGHSEQPLVIITAAVVVCICLVVFVIVCVKRLVPNGNLEAQEPKPHVQMQQIISVNSNSDIPNSKPDITELTEWLTNNVKLPQYVQNFADNGFETLEFVCDISAEDLQAIGVTLKGHKIRILAQVMKLKAGQHEEEKDDMIVKEKQNQRQEHKPQRSVLDELEGQSEVEEPLTLEGSPHNDNLFDMGSLSQDQPFEDLDQAISPK